MNKLLLVLIGLSVTVTAQEIKTVNCATGKTTSREISVMEKAALAERVTGAEARTQEIKNNQLRVLAAVKLLQLEASKGNVVAQSALVLFKELFSDIKE